MQDHYSQDKQSFSLFTNDTVKLTDKLDVTLGLRWTTDRKTLVTNYQNENGNGATCGAALNSLNKGNWAGLVTGLIPTEFTAGVLCLPWTNPYFNGLTTHQKLDENNVSGTAKVSYHWTPNVLTYASYARGFKDGGFNLDRMTTGNGQPNGGIGFVPVTNTSFPAETVDSYEAGAKTTWLHGKLLLDLTLFDEEFQHFQLNSFLGTDFVVEFDPQGELKGRRRRVHVADPHAGPDLPGRLHLRRHALRPLLGEPADQLDRFHADRLGGTEPAARFADRLRPGLVGFERAELRAADQQQPPLPVQHHRQVPVRLQHRLRPRALQGAAGLYAPEHAYRRGLGGQSLAVEFWVNNLTNVTYNQVVFDAPLQGLSMPLGARSTAPRPTPRPTTPS